MRMIGKVESFLTAYVADLNYHFNYGGIESLNPFTAGTPCFETEAEAEQYLADLNTTIELVRSD